MGASVHRLSLSLTEVCLDVEHRVRVLCCQPDRERSDLFPRITQNDLELTPTGPTVDRSDNRGMIDLSFDPVSFKKTNHIIRAAKFVRDLCLRRVVSIQRISGNNNQQMSLLRSSHVWCFASSVLSCRACLVSIETPLFARGGLLVRVPLGYLARYCTSSNGEFGSYVKQYSYSCYL